MKSMTLIEEKKKTHAYFENIITQEKKYESTMNFNRKVLNIQICFVRAYAISSGLICTTDGIVTTTPKIYWKCEFEFMIFVLAFYNNSTESLA